MADQLFSSVPDSKTAEYLIAWDIVKLLYYDKRLYQGGEKLDHAKSIAEAYVAVRDIMLERTKAKISIR